ncbi:putative ester cyclase [Duganella sp. 1224]|uniref:ester cyclase n=1 Tax=Duganella sp. 1224 TaxID=2587052 RepID=UPI0015CC93EE|nr:ester cyclase [Duganella sp. 1224]NYE62264.1 putative ester cyclase [Duganella sp. 1224]
MKALIIAGLLAGAVSQAAHADPVTDAARTYAAFWNTGDPALARQALSPDFIDRTLPAGREQGVNGPLQASQGFRAAVPDLKAEATHIVPHGDLVSVRLHFTGHFTGTFGEVRGKGQAIDFQAFDLYHVVNGRIAENWHLEDNLTLLRQMGIMPDPQSAPSKTQ